MSETIRYLREEYKQNDTPKKGGGGHEPPGGDKLEKRVEELEKSLKQVELSIVRIETTLDGFRTNVFPALATKADLAEEMGNINQGIANFRTDLTRMESSLIKWFVATAFLLSGGVGAIAFGLARAIPH